MNTAMENIKQMIDVNTVVGNAVETKTGAVIIPISQVSCGFAAGGAEYETATATQVQGEGYLPFGGGSGAGVSVKPVGFLVVKDNDVRLLTVKGNQLAERVVDLTPQILEKIEALMKGRQKEVPLS
ncbi:MAG: sporulation protein YtfJ [Syntrophomonadaceae bacterium]|nr:sporulation protein YtfJ [Syntrophomonadaceae bacterium]